MPQEKSAGFIVFNKDKFLLLHYGAGHWDFPKGHIEQGEKIEETARRELEEETGINDIYIVPGFEEKLEYFFKRDGKTVHKEVVFFLAETKTSTIKLSHEHIGFKWLPYHEALLQLTFRTAKDLLMKVEKFLKKKK